MLTFIELDDYVDKVLVATEMAQIIQHALSAHSDKCFGQCYPQPSVFLLTLFLELFDYKRNVSNSLVGSKATMAFMDIGLNDGECQTVQKQ